jgi:hypothetical protein
VPCHSAPVHTSPRLEHTHTAHIHNCNQLTCLFVQRYCVQRFGFSLQLFRPTAPFAIARQFCVGDTALFNDDSCCALNLCNARFDEPGECLTPCGPTDEILLAVSLTKLKLSSCFQQLSMCFFLDLFLQSVGTIS